MQRDFLMRVVLKHTARHGVWSLIIHGSGRVWGHLRGGSRLQKLGRIRSGGSGIGPIIRYWKQRPKWDCLLPVGRCRMDYHSALFVRGMVKRQRDLIIPVAALSTGVLAVLHSLIDFSLQTSGYALSCGGSWVPVWPIHFQAVARALLPNTEGATLSAAVMRPHSRTIIEGGGDYKQGK